MLIHVLGLSVLAVLFMLWYIPQYYKNTVYAPQDVYMTASRDLHVVGDYDTRVTEAFYRFMYRYLCDVHFHAKYALEFDKIIFEWNRNYNFDPEHKFHLALQRVCSDIYAKDKNFDAENHVDSCQLSVPIESASKHLLYNDRLDLSALHKLFEQAIKE